MIRRILVPLDGSDRSKVILPYVVDAASRWKTPVTLLRVVEPDLWETESALAQAQAARIAEVFSDLRLPVDVTVRPGKPEEEIMKVAFDVGADVIVIAMHPNSAGQAASSRAA